MPQTDSPNYVYRLQSPIWPPSKDPSSRNAFGSPEVKAGLDEIKASDINSLRLIIDLMYNHTHEYQDSIGSC